MFFVRFFILFLILSFAKLYSIDLPNFHNIDVKKDYVVGSQIRQSLYYSNKLITDIDTAYYISNLGRNLSKIVDKNNIFNFYFVDNNQINAFATYDQIIVIYKGLLLKTQTEAQLASVLAHEIAHITQGHLYRNEDFYKNGTLVMLGTLLGSAILQNDIGNAIFMGTAGAVAQTAMGYSRDMEWEADKVALDILLASSFNPIGQQQFFNLLLDNETADDIELLKTHPLSINRLAQSQVKTLGIAKGITNSFSFSVVKAKLQYNMNNNFVFRDKKVAKYIEIYHLFNLARYNKAWQVMQIWLSSLDYIDTEILILAARIANELGYYDKAKYYLTKIINIDSKNEVANYYLAQTHYKSNNIKLAIKKLRNFIRKYPANMESYKLLANYYSSYKDIVRYHITMADLYLNFSLLDKAMIHLLKAKNLTNSSYLTAIISAKLASINQAMMLLK